MPPLPVTCFSKTVLLLMVSWWCARPVAAEQTAAMVSNEEAEVRSLCIAMCQTECSVGLAEKNGPLLHDSAVLIDRDGTLLLRHRKLNILSQLMTPPYTSGEVIQVAQTRYGKIGLLIYY